MFHILSDHFLVVSFTLFCLCPVSPTVQEVKAKISIRFGPSILARIHTRWFWVVHYTSPQELLMSGCPVARYWSPLQSGGHLSITKMCFPFAISMSFCGWCFGTKQISYSPAGRFRESFGHPLMILAWISYFFRDGHFQLLFFQTPFIGQHSSIKTPFLTHRGYELLFSIPSKRQSKVFLFNYQLSEEGAEHHDS